MEIVTSNPLCDLIADDSKYAEDKSCDTFVLDF